MNTRQHRTGIHSSLHASIFLIAVLLLTGCSKPIDEAIVGKWDDGTGTTFEFFHDNTMLLVNGDERQSWTWTKVADDRIKIDITMLATTTTLVFEDIEISGNKITFTLNGEKAIMNRKK